MTESNVSTPSASSPSTSESSTLKSFTTLELAEFNTFIRNSTLDIFKIARDVKEVFIHLDALKLYCIATLTGLLKQTKGRAVERNHIIKKPYFFDNFTTKDEYKGVDLTFVCHALNFNLWYPQNAKQWTVRGQTGYDALCTVFERAIEERRPFWDPCYYSKLKQCDVEIIFLGDDENTNIPVINERVRILHEIAKVLLDKYEGSFVNCIKACDGDALKLHHLLYNEFEPYRDTVNYEGKEVYIGSKAAALISDLCFVNKLTGQTHSIPTVLADYCAPRVLFAAGILKYTDAFKAACKNNSKTYFNLYEPLEHGSRKDIEIRCCTLIAYKRMAQMLLSISKVFLNKSLTDEIVIKKVFVDTLNVYSFNIVDNFILVYQQSQDNLLFPNIKSLLSNVSFLLDNLNK